MMAIIPAITQLARRQYHADVSKQTTDAESPVMPECDFKPQPYKGPSYERICAIRRENLMPNILTYYKKPLLLHEGHMQWLWDHEGRRFLDFFGGIVTIGVGHCHPKVVKSLEEQSRQLWHTSNVFLHPKIHEYVEKLAAKMPGNLKVVYLVNSGSEAIELAMIMARLHTGRFDIISLQNAYHGSSSNAMGLTAMSNWGHSFPHRFGIQQTPVPDVYRGMFGGAHCRDSPVQTTRQCSCAPGECDANRRYLRQLADVIRFSIPKQGLAAFFAESIQGGGGVVQYPRDFIKNAYEMIRAKGGVCVADEVQTGFGRTGDHFWAFEDQSVIPDIVTMAKSIGNGFPLAAVVTTPEIARSLQHALHINTFGGNALACAVGSTVLDVIEEDGCQEVSKVVGGYLLERLSSLRDEFECVGDVRGKGLMVGFEMVTDKVSRTPLSAEVVNNILESCKELGLLIGKGGQDGNMFRIQPPMCITKKDVDFAVAVLHQAIRENVHKP